MNLKKLFITTLVLALPSLAIAEPPRGEGHREQIRALLEDIKEQSPERHARLMELKRVDPEGFRKTLKKIHHKMNGGPDIIHPAMRAQKEKMRELREDARDLIGAYRLADDNDQDRIRGEIEALASEIFDVRQSHRKMRLDKIRAQVEDLEIEIEQLAANREQWITDWVNNKTAAQNDDR